jgi:SAM-dependent methyltransferase
MSLPSCRKVARAKYETGFAESSISALSNHVSAATGDEGVIRPSLKKAAKPAIELTITAIMDGCDGGTDIKARVRGQFTALTDVWPNDDTWSRHTHSEISRRLHQYCERIIPKSGHLRLLNIGSHGNGYGIVADEHIHIDLVADALIGVPLAAAADAELLPIPSDSVDVVICVGSVINYCSPPKVFSEISRVLKPLGYLLLEFEASDSFEFARTNDFSRDVTLVETFYNGVADKIYVYSARYVISALGAAGMAVEKLDRFHRLSTLIYRLTRREKLSAAFARFDRALAKLPVIKNYSANIFLLAQKSG